MARSRQHEVAPHIPALDDILQEKIRLAYHRLADSPSMSGTGEPRPACNEYIDDDTIVLIDLETNEVAGMEIDHFLARALHPQDTTE